jgi:hypothetical protein
LGLRIGGASFSYGRAAGSLRQGGSKLQIASHRLAFDGLRPSSFPNHLITNPHQALLKKRETSTTNPNSVSAIRNPKFEIPHRAPSKAPIVLFSGQTGLATTAVKRQRVTGIAYG